MWTGANWLTLKMWFEHGVQSVSTAPAEVFARCLHGQIQAQLRVQKTLCSAHRVSDKKRPVKQAVTFLTACFGKQTTAVAGRKIAVFRALTITFYANGVGGTPCRLLYCPEYNALEKPGFCLTDKAAH
jgi:hypothetical protein